MKDILNMFGPNSPASQSPRATNGGQCVPSDVMNYKPPTGPSNINDSKSPGLHGTNHGNAAGQGKH